MDYLGKAYYENLHLPLSERVGYVLKEGAKHVPISFGTQILPFVYFNFQSDNMGFNFSEGLYYPYELDNTYNQETAQEHRSPLGKILDDSGAMWGGNWGGHSNPDFGMIVNLGTDGIREMITREMLAHPGKESFYRGCLHTMDALDILGERFYNLAVRNASSCDDAADKKRYELAAKAFEVIPKKPAYDFTSACHAFWMLFTFDGNDSPGRFDQYMYRAYAASTDHMEILDVLGRLWDCFHEMRSWNLCLSGSDEFWNDKTNDLTYDILKLAAEKKYETPNITMRVHRNTPQKLWDAATETLASGIGMPVLYNDEVICAALEKIGIPPCDSHLYCMNGCNQIDIMGKSHMGLEDGEVNFAKCLEYTLHNGMNALTKNQDSISTGDARTFASYEELEQALLRQIEHILSECLRSANTAQELRAKYRPNPLRSSLIEGCLQKGIDYRNGGPLYNHGQILAEGIADTGDSLFAIKKLVFDEKKYTMSELIDALEADFAGYEKLHHDFSNCEKFGNDIPEVDKITTGIMNQFCAMLKKHHTFRGGVYTGGCSVYMRAAHYGRLTGALPNGRHNAEPLFSDCIGAYPGQDKKGPTALLKSVLLYAHTECCSGFVLQLKFDKKIFQTEKGKAAFQILAKTYFAQGGQQFTTSVVSPEELLDAKIHPEKHGNLIVRVGGYSDYFVNLEPDLQDNVIARTVL